MILESKALALGEWYQAAKAKALDSITIKPPKLKLWTPSR